MREVSLDDGGHLSLPLEEALTQMSERFEEMLVRESLNEIIELNFMVVPF